MEPKDYIRILDTVEALKNNTRHSWTSAGRHESVADHSWRLTLMAFFARDEFPAADMDKVIRMCIVHDIGEAFTGDVPSFRKTAAHEAAEAEALRRWVDALPAPYRAELTALYAEMDALETTEAKIYKALDNLEAVAQHNEADIATWLPLEHTLQLTYGGDRAAFSPWLTALKAQLNADSRRKMADAAQGAAPAAGAAPPLCLRAANEADWEKEYQFLQAIPPEENGFYNDYHGLTPEQFRTRALPELLAHAAGRGLPPGFVPETYFFLWQGGSVLGLFKVRHRLNDALRAGAGHIGYSIAPEYRGGGYAKKGLALAVAALRGLLPPEEREVYLSCSRKNPASLAVQKANGAYVHHTDEREYYTRIPLD
jgi:putative hydrolase of HD superfamily